MINWMGSGMHIVCFPLHENLIVWLAQSNSFIYESSWIKWWNDIWMIFSLCSTADNYSYSCCILKLFVMCKAGTDEDDNIAVYR